jgi:hypothetical protein
MPHAGLAIFPFTNSLPLFSVLVVPMASGSTCSILVSQHGLLCGHGSWLRDGHITRVSQSQGIAGTSTVLFPQGLQGEGASY